MIEAPESYQQFQRLCTSVKCVCLCLWTPKIAPASKNREEGKFLLEKKTHCVGISIMAEMGMSEETRDLHFFVVRIKSRSFTHNRINYLGGPKPML